MAGGPLEAPKRASNFQRGTARLALEPRHLKVPLARSLSIAGSQISYVYRESKLSSVNRSRLAMEFGTVSNRSVFSELSTGRGALHRPFHSARRPCNQSGTGGAE